MILIVSSSSSRTRYRKLRAKNATRSSLEGGKKPHINATPKQLLSPSRGDEKTGRNSHLTLYSSTSFHPGIKSTLSPTLFSYTARLLYTQWVSSIPSAQNTSSIDSNKGTRGARNAPPSPPARSTSTANTSTTNLRPFLPRARNQATVSAKMPAEGERIACLSLPSRRSFLRRQATGRRQVVRFERALSRGVREERRVRGLS